MKRLLFILFVIVSISTYSQKEISFNINISNYNYSLNYADNILYPNREIKYTPYSNNIGGSILIQLNKQLYIKTGLNYLNQRFDISYGPHFDISETYKDYIVVGRFADIRYCEIPLLVTLKVKESKIINLYHSIGISNNILYKIKYEYLLFKDIYSSIDREFFVMTDDFNTKINNYVISAVFSVHFDINICKNFGVNVEGNFNYGLSNYYKECNTSTMTYYSWRAGIFYKFNYKKEQI